MCDRPDPTLTAFAEMLEQCGYSRQEAQALVIETVRKQASIEPGFTWGHMHPEQIGELWKQAAIHGKRRLLLEITADALSADEWDGHLNVEVKESQTWTSYEQQRAEARAREMN